MKMSFIAASIIFALARPGFAADAACRPVTVSSEIELPAGEFVLADLLSSNACPAILSAARRVHLGNVPLAGSPRVFTGEEIRAELQRLRLPEGRAAEFAAIPERVIVRRKDDTGSGAGLARARVRDRKPKVLAASAAAGRNASGGNETVRPGQTVILVWDQDGIRLQVPALCLEAGILGAKVRARILRGNRVVRAIVESGKSLRVVS
jgi:hypothetical protein